MTRSGNGLDDGEFCVVLSTESQCARERRPGRSRKINRTEDAREFNHDLCSVWMKGERGRPEASDQRQRLRRFAWRPPSARKPKGGSVRCVVHRAHPTPIEANGGPLARFCRSVGTVCAVETYRTGPTRLRIRSSFQTETARLNVKAGCGILLRPRSTLLTDVCGAIVDSGRVLKVGLTSHSPSHSGH